LSALIISLIANVLLSSIGSQLNESFAKTCANENIGNVAISSCGLQGLQYPFLSSPGNDVRTKTAGNSLTTHANSNSNSGDSSRSKNSESPFVLPFP
jgi:hypothetical protein